MYNRKKVEPTKNTDTKRPRLMDAAGWMALPIGIMWSASFLSTMYGARQPFLSMLGTALGLASIYMLYRQLSNYRRLYPSSWLHIVQLSLVTCLLAGLLTDAAQYAYFLLLDDGQLLTRLAEVMQSEEYRRALRQMMPEADIGEAQKMLQNLTVRDIMLQLVVYNAFLSLPVSLLAALPVREVKRTRKES